MGLVDELKELAALHRASVLNDQEFRDAKATLIAGGKASTASAVATPATSPAIKQTMPSTMTFECIVVVLPPTDRRCATVLVGSRWRARAGR